MKLEGYFKAFRDQIIGIEQTIETPYGERKICYLDWTASGRLYHRIENQIANVFGPFVANTHSESNITGETMTHAYREALSIIKKHVNADEQDVIITEGTGMTGVINKLQRMLGLRLPESYKNRIELKQESKPVVFVTHMEHHSNQLSWVETIADVEIIHPNERGEVDLDHLKRLLEKYKNRNIKIGSFTACSNVTGIQTPYYEMARLMHENGGICIVDFSASAPYVKIDMHPENKEEKLDAIVFSPHKFLGGPGSSGVLIFDSRLYHNEVPDHPGGGTVLWTNPWNGRAYVPDIEEKEDGGTPGFLQAIRTALSIRLKEQMGVTNMIIREEQLLHALFEGLNEIKGIHILDGHIRERLGIVSFYIEQIHYHLLVRLLNDRYGIQVRGGCSCAGTYGHFLLNIDQEKSKQITDEINRSNLSVKPGWVRLSIHPTTTMEEVIFFVQGMKEIVENIHKWKHDYNYNAQKNDFKHKNTKYINTRNWFHL